MEHEKWPSPQTGKQDERIVISNRVAIFLENDVDGVTIGCWVRRVTPLLVIVSVTIGCLVLAALWHLP